jgi:peptidoglycan-associated lipoprotein
MRFVRSALIPASAFALCVGLACNKPQPVPDAKPETRAPKVETKEAVPDKPSDSRPQTMDAMEMARRAAAGVLKNINFDFDKSDIREADKGKLQAIAGFMKSYPQVKLNLEGHCDERGTVEYNIALGDRRGHAAMRYLVGLGVAEGRMNPVSYGKERPLVTGHDEQSWLENRRCEFKISN